MSKQQKIKRILENIKGLSFLEQMDVVREIYDKLLEEQINIKAEESLGILRI